MARPALVFLLLAVVLAACAAEGQKAEDAKKALADAKAAHEHAVEHAKDALRTLEDFVKKTRSQEGARRTAAAIEQGAAVVNAGDLKTAQDSFRGRLSDVAAAEGDALKGLTEQAGHAAEHVVEVDKRQARETRSIWAQMQKDKKKEAKGLFEEAKTAAKATAKTAKSLEQAQRHAGVKESVFERDADQNMDAASRMEDRAKDLQDAANDSIESFFGEVESYVERRSDAVADEAVRHHEEMRKSIRAAVREAQKKEAERAQQAKREVQKKKVAKAPKGNDTQADDGNSPSDGDSEAAPAPVLLTEQLSDLQPKDGDSAKGESDKELAKEAQEQKAEDPKKKALADAQEAHKKAIERADNALRALEDLVKKTNSQKNAQNVAEAIEKGAAQIAASELDDAQKGFKDSLSALAGAEGESVDADAEKARHAADDVALATRRQAHQIRSIWAQMQKDKKKEARNLGDEAKKAARELGKTAKSLEQAQRHAGVKESVFERDADKSMDAASKMEDRAEDLRDRAEDSIERFFGDVEGYVERHSDAVADEAHRHRIEMHDSVRVAERRARAKQAKQAQRAKQPEAAPKHAAAPASEKNDSSADDQASEKKDSSADDGASEKKDSSANAGTPAPTEFLALAAPRSAIESASALGAAGLLIMASTGFGLLAALCPRRRSFRDAPPLLG